MTCGWNEPCANAAGPGVCGVCGRDGLGVLGLRGVNGLAAGFSVKTFLAVVPGFCSPLPVPPPPLAPLSGVPPTGGTLPAVFGGGAPPTTSVPPPLFGVF